MTRSIVPTSIPSLPEEGVAWLRSTRGRGGMYHIHTGLGGTACESLRLDRHHSEGFRHLGDLQYWGLCPRCLAKVPAPVEEPEPQPVCQRCSGTRKLRSGAHCPDCTHTR